MNSLFGYAALDDFAYRDWLKAQLEEYSAEWIAAHQLSLKQTRQWPRAAVQARASVLKAVYGGDYHTDSFDVARLAGRVADGSERVWFWGDPEELRRIWNETAAGVERTVPRVGTVSVLDATAEFGAGHLEMCRSGSLSAVAATPFSVLRVFEFLQGDLDGNGPVDAIILVPRARASRDGIRGGEAVNRLHREKIRSSFWGFAPWYVMQGGFLEILEYREVLRERRAVLSALKLGSLFFCDESDRRYVEALLQHNLGNSGAQLVTLPSDGGTVEQSLAQLSDSPPDLRRFNHVTLAAQRSGRTPIGEALQLGADYASTVVRIDLADPASLGTQALLNKSGFTLTCFSPGKASRKGSRREMWGYWSRPNPELSLAPPFYWRESPPSVNDAVILDRLLAISTRSEASGLGAAGSGGRAGLPEQRRVLAPSER